MLHPRTLFTRTLPRAVPLALVVMLLVATAAAAHPFVRGGEAPVDSLASLELNMAHGCILDGGGHSHGEAEADGEPTTDVSLEVPSSMRIVEVPEVDGWEVELETDADGTVEVVTWTATTAVEPAPEFLLDVVIDGQPGDELFLRVFQACDDFIYRWVGTPDDPADDPAIRLTLTEPDPDRPAPDPEPPAEEADPAEEAVVEESEDPTEEPAAEEPPLVEEGVEAEDLEASPIAVPDDGETNPLLWAVVGLVAALVVIAVILALRRRPVAEGAPDPDTDATEGDATGEVR